MIIATIYFGLAESAQLVPAINPAATPLWPPTGVALALVLLRGYRVWPAIYVGAFFAHAITSISSDAITVGSLSESGFDRDWHHPRCPGGGVATHRWLYGRKTFETPLGIVKFALISFAPTAMIGSAFAVAGQVSPMISDLPLPDLPFAGTWATWWLADAAGTVLIAPVIVLWAMTTRRSLSNRACWNAPQSSLLRPQSPLLLTAP